MMTTTMSGTDRADPDLRELETSLGADLPAPDEPWPRAAVGAAVTLEVRLPRTPVPVPRDALPPVVAVRSEEPVPRPRALRPRSDRAHATVGPTVERLGDGTIATYRHGVVPETGSDPRADRRDGPDSGMDPRVACSLLATAALEVISGSRPLAQLARWVSPAVYDALEQRRVLAGDAGGLRAGSPGRTGPVGPRPSVRRVRAMRVDDRTVESSVVLRHADRVRAVAIRLVDSGGVWRAEALVVG